MSERRKPTSPEWETILRDKVTHMSRDQGMTSAQIERILAEDDSLSQYDISKRSIDYHLHNCWGIDRYQRRDQKTELYRTVREALQTGQALPEMDQRQIKRLIDHCREQSKQSDLDPAVTELLKNLNIAATAASVPHTTLAQEEMSSDVELHNQGPAIGDLGTASTDLDEDQLAFILGSESLATVLPEPDLIPSTSGSLDEPEQTDWDQTYEFGDIEPVAHFEIVPQPAHFNDQLAKASKTCALSQQYYRFKLEDHRLTLQSFDLMPNVAGLRPWEDMLRQNRKFWTKIKSGIYYLKKNDELLWRQELGLAQPLMQSLSQNPPVSLLKDLLATISPVATLIRPSIRSDILRAFIYYGSGQDSGPQSVFLEICRLLLDDPSDEVVAVTLQAMLDASSELLLLDNSELFELQRTMVRFTRRMQHLYDAERTSWSFIRTCEQMFGRNHVNTRLALSERVYILNDRGDYISALAVAEDVWERAQLDLGGDQPNDRIIYAMEDIAEICEKLGRLSDAIVWLLKASRAALDLWGNSPGTVHIWNKLNDIQEERYQLAVIGQEWHTAM